MSFATDQVALLKAAYQAVLRGQSYRMGDQMLTKADAAWISAELDKWLRREASEKAAAAGSSGYAIADFSGGPCWSNFRVSG